MIFVELLNCLWLMATYGTLKNLCPRDKTHQISLTKKCWSHKLSESFFFFSKLTLGDVKGGGRQNFEIPCPYFKIQSNYTLLNA